MLDITAERLQEVAQDAFDACQGKRLGDRWQRAIAKAKQQLENNPFIHDAGASLLILSPDSLQIYEANGVCQCKAYAQGWPCWHRAAYRLVRRAASH